MTLKKSTIKNVLTKKIWIPILVYAVLSMLILFPLLKKGFVFTMDNITPLRYSFPTDFTTWRVIHNLINALTNLIFPSYVIEKITLFLILFLSGLNAHFLIDTKSIWPKYFSGILYMINPFVYSRLVYGQNDFLLAYAIAPLFIKIIIDLLEIMSWKKMLLLFISSVVVFFLNIRNVNFLEIIAFSALIVLTIKYLKNYQKIFHYLKWIIFFLAIFIFITFRWINPLINSEGKDILNVDKNQEIYFQTDSDKTYGLFFNVLSMYGFWGDREHYYVNMKNFNSGWPFLSVSIIVLSLIGIIHGLREKKYRLQIIMFIIIFILAYILSIGIANSSIYKVDLTLQKIFFIKALREPQKFVSLLVICYCFFGALGFDWILYKANKDKLIKKIMIVIIIFLPLIYSSGLFWAARNQLYTSNYPESWTKINRIFLQDKSDYKVLFFPWHRYMSFNFTNRKIIENPAPIFYSKPIISGDNLEMGNIYTQSVSHQSDYIKREIIDKGNDRTNIADLVLGFNVKYIILAKEVDYLDYSFLDKQDGLEIIFESDDIKLYKNSLFKE